MVQIEPNLKVSMANTCSKLKAHQVSVKIEN